MGAGKGKARRARAASGPPRKQEGNDVAAGSSESAPLSEYTRELEETWGEKPFMNRNPGDYARELEHRGEVAMRFLDDHFAKEGASPALGDDQIMLLGRDQRDMLLVGWPEDCSLTVTISADDVMRPHPALYVISDIPGGTPAKIDHLGRIGPAEEIPEGQTYTVDREAIKVFNLAVDAAAPPRI